MSTRNPARVEILWMISLLALALDPIETLAETVTITAAEVIEETIKDYRTTLGTITNEEKIMEGMIDMVAEETTDMGLGEDTALMAETEMEIETATDETGQVHLPHRPPPELCLLHLHLDVMLIRQCQQSTQPSQWLLRPPLPLGMFLHLKRLRQIVS